MNEINLVNEIGVRIGSIEKLEAHIKGKLHEAFSIFIFNKKQELLLQKRALTKYHSGGLWTNTCCSHPKAGEKLEIAVHRRIKEEMGFDSSMKEMYTFTYKVKIETGNLIENEFDHVFIGYVDAITIKPNSEEVDAYKWIQIEDLKKEVDLKPEQYTEWLKIILNSGKLDLNR